jgi:hypothetical protein
MKLKVRDRKRPEDRSEKFLSIRQKYRRMKLAAIIISSSWFITEVVRHGKEIRQIIQSLI